MNTYLFLKGFSQCLLICCVKELSVPSGAEVAVSQDLASMESLQRMKTSCSG